MSPYLGLVLIVSGFRKLLGTVSCRKQTIEKNLAKKRFVDYCPNGGISQVCATEFDQEGKGLRELAGCCVTTSKFWHWIISSSVGRSSVTRCMSVIDINRRFTGLTFPHSTRMWITIVYSV